jgi:Zn-finger nucleic acid-binding protein
MHTFNRNGVQIEQCSGCRGIFLDYGELETLARIESQWSQQPPIQQSMPPQAYPSAGHAPAWGAPHGGGHYGGHHHKKSFGHMLFSS